MIKKSVRTLFERKKDIITQTEYLIDNKKKKNKYRNKKSIILRMFPHTIHETLQSFSQVIKISNIAALMAVVVFVVKPAIF